MQYTLRNVLKATEESFVAVVEPLQTRMVLKFSTKDRSEGEEEKRILDLLRENDCRNILYYLDCHFMVDAYCFIFPYIKQVPFPTLFPKIWQFLEKIANAVSCCHANNIVHCDIKPDNLLISENDVLLCDFGCAQIERKDEPMWYGTTEYWSPEVCEESLTANEFPRDLWALGVTIIELVYNTYPFSTKPHPDYIGGNQDRARADALTTSAQDFLNLATKGKAASFSFTLLAPSPPSPFSFHLHLLQFVSDLTDDPFPTLSLPQTDENKKLHQLLHGLLCWDPEKRTTAHDAKSMIKNWSIQDEQKWAVTPLGSKQVNRK